MNPAVIDKAMNPAVIDKAMNPTVIDKAMNPAVIDILLKCAIKYKNTDKELEYLNKILEFDPNHAIALQMISKYFPDCERMFLLKSLKLCPTLYDSMISLGDLGELEYYHKALKSKDTKHIISAMYGIANNYIIIGKYTEAENILLKLIKKYKKYISWKEYTLLAQCYGLRNKEKEIKYLIKAHDIDKQQTEPLFNLINYHIKSEFGIDQIRKYIGNILEIDRNNIKALLLLSKYANSSGIKKGAYLRILAIDDKHFEANFAMGHFYYGSEKSREYFYKAFEIRPNDGIFLAILHTIKYNDIDEMLKLYSKNSSSAHVSRLLEMIKRCNIKKYLEIKYGNDNYLQNDYKTDTCAVCMDVFCVLDIQKLICGHYFHGQCLKRSEICPLCREPIINVNEL